MSESSDDRLTPVVDELRQFAHEREWSQFHDPKNLAMAIVSEAGELAAEYCWVPNDKADEWSGEEANRSRVSAEAADVGIALLMFCDRIGVDFLEALRAKIAVNRANYPIDASRGRSQRPDR